MTRTSSDWGTPSDGEEGRRTPRKEEGGGSGGIRERSPCGEVEEGGPPGPGPPPGHGQGGGSRWPSPPRRGPEESADRLPQQETRGPEIPGVPGIPLRP